MLNTFKNRVRVISGFAMRRSLAGLLGLMTLFLMANVAASQELKGAQTQDYKLGPDDVVGVTVRKHPEFSAEAVTVTPDGKIRLPVVDEILVSGKTLQQVNILITNALRKRLKFPEVTVTLKQTRLQRIFVLGAVGKAGVYDFKPGWRVSEALAAAGGLIGRPELTSATLTRANRPAVALDLPRILTDGNSPANMTLQVGDTLQFSERTYQITVAGEVQRPAVYSVPVGQGVVEAVAIAGGANLKAALTKVTVKRPNGKVLPVDLYKAQVIGDPSANLKLEEGDLVVVPKATATVSVQGAVVKPGFIDIEDGRTLRVSELLAQAGGPAARAALSKTIVTRKDGTSVPVDLHKVVNLNDKQDDIELRADDVVTIPDMQVRVTVQGAVQKPGPIDIEDGRTLSVSQALARAGGPAARAALSKTIVTRKDGTSVPVDLHKVVNLNDKKDDIQLAADDIVTVPDAQTRVTVLGAVEKPGVFDIEDGRTLRVADAVALAGNATPKASLIRASVQRADGTVMPVNLHRIITQGDQADNFVLAADDVVIIPQSMRVSVVGAVALTGTYNFEEGTNPRVSDVLARAGGLSTRPDQLPQVRISITRQKKENGKIEILQVDPVALLESRNQDQLSQNVPVQDGDIISVSVAKAQTVFVNGEVKSPGMYELKEGDSVVDLIVRAGGQTEEAALRQVTVQERGGNSQVVDVFEALKKGGQKPNVILHEGDLVVVPENKARVTVLGAVNRQGDYAVPEDEPLTVRKAMSLAGGPTPQAHLSRVGIAREGARPEIIQLDNIKARELGVDRILRPGDFLFVPAKKQRTNILSTMLQVLTGFRLLR